MNKVQLQEILSYLDAEYAGIINRMSDAERKNRAEHWAREIGPLDFDTTMTAVRNLARNAFMPRTAEVLAEVEKLQQTIQESKQAKKTRCRIMRDAAGNEILDLRYSDGSQWMTGSLSNLPEWMQIKFRWMANPNAENTLAWDSFIQAYEEEREETLMAMEEVVI